MNRLISLSPDLRLGYLSLFENSKQALLDTLAELEKVSYAMDFDGEDALIRQLIDQFGVGIWRIDSHLPICRNKLAEFGIAAASLEGDWQNSKLVWMFNPTEADYKKAQNLGIPMIADASFSPFSDLSTKADFLTYFTSAVLSGVENLDFCILFSKKQITRYAKKASDLNTALIIRDIGTLILRISQMSRNIKQLQNLYPAEFLPLGELALILPPNKAKVNVGVLGNVNPASLNVTGGIIITAGIVSSLKTINKILEFAFLVEPSKQIIQTDKQVDKVDKQITQVDKQVDQSKLEFFPKESLLIPDYPQELDDNLKSTFTPEQNACYKNLINWRNQEATNKGISTFLLFSNKTLRKIVSRKPKKIEDIKDLMDKYKLKLYGHKILLLTTKHLDN